MPYSDRGKPPDLSILVSKVKNLNDQEVILIAKTTEKRVPELIEKVKSMHGYECPCIVSLPVIDGNEAFLEWIKDQVK
ncbi:MAG: divalent-cation tolerance protein CutA [Desulfobacterales bacterium]|nr:divalent-cation tolerance protein CutA [Desulfobacterales bacterium]